MRVSVIDERRGALGLLRPLRCAVISLPAPGGVGRYQFHATAHWRSLDIVPARVARANPLVSGEKAAPVADVNAT